MSYRVIRNANSDGYVGDPWVDDLEVQKWDAPSGVIKVASHVITRTIECEVLEYPGAEVCCPPLG